MGGQDFTHKAKGKTAKEAFANAREDAQYENGHGGYTGTIAEKYNFVMDRLPAGADLDDYVWNRAAENDKWGPAFCLDLGGGEFLFFGVASS